MLEFIEAVFKAGVPVGAVSFMLYFYSLKGGQFTETGNLKRLKAEMKAYKKSKAHKKKSGNILHDKWMKFGGGFYGVMAFWTYLTVEMKEIWDFFEGVSGWPQLVELLTFSNLVRLLIDSITNFITAITWPFYWMNELSGNSDIMWLLVVYGGYSLGMNYGRHKAHEWHLSKENAKKEDDKEEDDEVTKAGLFTNKEYLAIAVTMAISSAFLFVNYGEEGVPPSQETPVELPVVEDLENGY